MPPSPPEILPLSREEIRALQIRASKGETPSLEEIRRYIASTRVSYLSAESRTKPKIRTRKAEPDENQLDFF